MKSGKNLEDPLPCLFGFRLGLEQSARAVIVAIGAQVQSSI